MKTNIFIGSPHITITVFDTKNWVLFSIQDGGGGLSIRLNSYFVFELHKKSQINQYKKKDNDTYYTDSQNWIT